MCKNQKYVSPVKPNQVISNTHFLLQKPFLQVFVKPQLYVYTNISIVWQHFFA